MCRPALRVHSDEGNGFVVYESLPDGVVLEVVEGDRDQVVELGAVLHQAHLRVLKRGKEENETSFLLKFVTLSQRYKNLRNEL